LKELALFISNKNGTYESENDKIEQVGVRARVRTMTENGVGGYDKD
jgi:hypothetical protein